MFCPFEQENAGQASLEQTAAVKPGLPHAFLPLQLTISPLGRSLKMRSGNLWKIGSLALQISMLHLNLFLSSQAHFFLQNRAVKNKD